MSTLLPVTWLGTLKNKFRPLFSSPATGCSNNRPPLSAFADADETRLPRWIRESAVAMKYRRLLGGLDWENFPQRPHQHPWPGVTAMPYAPVVAAYLVKLDQQLPYMSRLRDYLVEHPALVWLLGFPLVSSRQYSWGFDVEASLPTHRHLSRLLRTLANDTLQVLLDATVHQLAAELRTEIDDFGDCISLDTKHIIAWVKENNPKAYTKGKRFDQNKQPAGDPDCRVGCKRKSNQKSHSQTPTTPKSNPKPASTVAVGEYYWGYGSGVVATKVPGWGEFVLAELTQPFNQSDVSYFYPLMAATMRRLGHRPKYGAFDAAFDAFYIYQFFDEAGGFAAVPFVERGPQRRSFNDEGLPLCAAGLPMPLKGTFQSKTSFIVHEKGRFACPLLYPTVTAEECPINHKNWPKGGCLTTMATSVGARLRYQLDRQGAAYKEVYRQRTATERINSQAVALGIERPKLRNGLSVANHNTLIYVLINLRALQRIRQRKAEFARNVNIP